MDPLTATFLFVLAVLWLIRRGAEDVTSMAFGREAPRVTRLKMRRAENRLTVAEALSVRLARWIATGRDRDRPGPFRLYASELWADSWEDARASHERRRHAKRAAPAPPAQQWEPATTDVIWDQDDDITDAEVVDTWLDPWRDEDSDQPSTPESPESTPAQEPAREEPPMPTPTNTVTVSGDVSSPVKAMKWADGHRDANMAIKEQLVHLANRLKGAGLSPEVLAQVGAVIGAAERFDSGVRGARNEYADHVLVQAELLSDIAVRDAVVGYLAAATA